MITIIYSTHKDKEYNDKFNDHLVLTSGLQWVQILPYENFNEYSLSELYNKGIKNSKYDIVVCCHNDIKLEKGWGKKLLEDFSNNPEFGIIGKAGSCYFPESGVYWERMNQTMVGQVYHHPENQKKWLSQYSPKLPFLIPVVTIDGLFISFDKTKIKHTFDESYGKFHFYDHGFSFPNYLDGVKVGVTSSFEITHQSVGQPNQEFWESKEKFVKKWSNNLPSDLLPTRIFVPEIKEKPIKNVGKVAVIIPTKGKTNLLIQCLDSFIEHSNSQYFHIFVADTGSKEEEISEIKNYIDKNSSRVSITLIEYDYYNFAKINNDVVKNHIGDEYEYLLFCNNDIKILNNIIYGMLKIMKEHPRTGTVGCRLHFEDNTVQHGGVFAGINSQGQFILSHNNLKSYYNYPTSFKKVFGNTGALMMIRKNVFEKCDGFNEKYTTCFEDVELNAKCLLMGYENYFDGSLVSYHFESQTRGKDEINSKGESFDYTQTFIPFISQNISKLRSHIVSVN
jgi:GT2 family glycosyltransferase